MKRIIKTYTYTEMKSILDMLYKDKAPIGEIADGSHRSVMAIGMIRTHYGAFLKGGRGATKIWQEYFSRYLKENNSPERIEKKSLLISQPTIEPSRYDRMKQAYLSFEGELQQFIQAEVNERVIKVQEENKQLKETVERLQKENDKYQEAFVEAKNSNWVDNLRRSWGG